MLLARAAAEHVKVVLTGEGSDELLGGYDYFRVDKALRPLGVLPASVRRVTGALASTRHTRASQVHTGPQQMRMARYANLTGPIKSSLNVLAPQVQDALAELERRNTIESELPIPDAFGTWDRFSQLQYYEMKIRLPDRIENSLDHATMAHSLEARVPFLDHVLVEFCAGIPASVKMRWLNEKQVLRDAMKDVLPRELAQRRKRGMASPIKPWLDAKLPEFAQVLLSDREVRKKGYFDPKVIAMMRDQPGELGERYGRRLMTVLTVQLWDELFIQGTPLHAI